MECAASGFVGFRYVHNDRSVADSYPYNPSGSPYGIAALTNTDGRVTITMPHPERSFRYVQNSWRPETGERIQRLDAAVSQRTKIRGLAVSQNGAERPRHCAAGKSHAFCPARAGGSRRSRAQPGRCRANRSGDQVEQHVLARRPSREHPGQRDDVGARESVAGRPRLRVADRGDGDSRCRIDPVFQRPVGARQIGVGCCHRVADLGGCWLLRWLCCDGGCRLVNSLHRGQLHSRSVVAQC